MSTPRTRIAIIPCSKEKIWDLEPDRGATPAKFAYTSSLHLLCQEYAEKYADGWIILSAKYGFLSPEDSIPATYDITFSRPEDPVISVDDLSSQAEGINADELLLLLPPDYETRVRSAFRDRPMTFLVPLGTYKDIKTMEIELAQALNNHGA